MEPFFMCVPCICTETYLFQYVHPVYVQEPIYSSISTPLICTRTYIFQYMYTLYMYRTYIFQYIYTLYMYKNLYILVYVQELVYSSICTPCICTRSYIFQYIYTLYMYKNLYSLVYVHPVYVYMYKVSLAEGTLKFD